jgi:TonB family protein
MSVSSDNSLFSMLPERRAPWKEFVFSMGTEAVVLLLLAWVGVFHPEIIVAPKRDHQVIQLVSTPPPVNHQPAPLRVIKPAYVPPPVAVPPVQEALRVPPPEIKHIAPKVDQPVAPRIEVAAKVPAVPALTPVVPRKLVKLDTFTTGSSMTPTIAQAPKKTQTGGFGDPNGVPAADNHGKPVTIAQLGSFDMPTGPGSGNGTGGAKGARGVIASAGFGNGVAKGDGSGSTNSSRGTVRQAGFGDAEVVANSSHPAQSAAVAPKMVPAEILVKPLPIYTDEARKLRIEGEVLLEVVFESTGKIRVVRVIRGLGHGLDEAAVQAAQQIHFKPALQDGQPADSTAVLHIVFQLA